MNKTGLQVCEAISLQTMCVKFCLNAIVLWVSRMSGLYPEYGIKMMEIKVAEINAPLN